MSTVDLRSNSHFVTLWENNMVFYPPFPTKYNLENPRVSNVILKIVLSLMLPVYANIPYIEVFKFL